jgi:hypothetical protein
VVTGGGGVQAIKVAELTHQVLCSLLQAKQAAVVEERLFLSPEQCGYQPSLLADRLPFEMNSKRFGLRLGCWLRLGILTGVCVKRLVVVSVFFRRWCLDCRRMRRSLPLNIQLCRGQHLDPTWKVVLGFIPYKILETGPDAMLTVKDHLVRDLHDKEASFWGRHINPSDHSFGKALHRTGRMKVHADLIPYRNLLRQSLNHSG